MVTNNGKQSRPAEKEEFISGLRGFYGLGWWAQHKMSSDTVKWGDREGERLIDGDSISDGVGWRLSEDHLSPLVCDHPHVSPPPLCTLLNVRPDHVCPPIIRSLPPREPMLIRPDLNVSWKKLCHSEID